MSSLINRDKRAKYNAEKMFASIGNYSPFSEFDDVNGDTNKIKIHFGRCPNIIKNIEQHIINFEQTRPKINIIMVIFSIVKPKNDGEPFLEYYVQRTHNDTLSFPFATLQTNGLMCESANNILESLKMTTKHLGFLKYDDNTYYSIFEAEHYECGLDGGTVLTSNTQRINHFYTTNDVLWITTSEIINKQVLNMDIENNAFIFITDIGEGFTRLYNNDKLIPSPRIGYIGGDIDYIEEIVNNCAYNTIEIGDFNYGIISAFFNDIIDNTRDETIKEMRNSGVILRIAFWDKPYKLHQQSYTVKNTKSKTYCNHTDDKIELYSFDVPEQQSYPLSIHHGEILNNMYNCNHKIEMNALDVLKNKMIIFK